MYKIKSIPIKLRPRERLKEVGVENLTDQELLAIILKTGTKDKNVLDLSLDILNKYNLFDLDNISLTNLKTIKGIGEVKAIELLASIELGKRIVLKPKQDSIKLTSSKEIYEAVKYLFHNKKQEYFYCLYFDNNNILISKKLLFVGTINKSITHPREVFKEAYLVSASYIICLHNHPSGNITPSKEDIKFTNSLISLGKIQGIPIIDHLIIGNNNYYSFYEDMCYNGKEIGETYEEKNK